MQKCSVSHRRGVAKLPSDSRWMLYIDAVEDRLMPSEMILGWSLLIGYGLAGASVWLLSPIIDSILLSSLMFLLIAGILSLGALLLFYLIVESWVLVVAVKNYYHEFSQLTNLVDYSLITPLREDRSWLTMKISQTKNFSSIPQKS